MACLPTATYSAPGVSLYAALGSGGGGSLTANPNFSTISMASYDGATAQGIMSFVAPGSGSTSTLNLNANPFFTAAMGNPSLNVTYTEGNVVTIGGALVAGKLGLIGQGGAYNTQVPGVINGDGAGGVIISTLTVSSINGAAPGGSSFFSTLSVPLPTQTSTVIFSFTPGTWTYNGLGLFTGATEPFNGFVNVISNVAQGVNYGSLFANSNSQPSAGTVPSEMTLNFGDSGLSTIKLICANNSASQTGTWQGAVIKLN